MEKLILTDCDGVLCDWEKPFRTWMAENGYAFNEAGKNNYKLHHHFHDVNENEVKKLAKFFNESATIGYLPPLRDSVYYVKRLYEEHGYRFRVITSLSLNKHAKLAREYNLKTLFGDAIESVICLSTGADKDQALAPYKDSGLFWIEDKPENAELGHKLGLRSILIEHGHNMNYLCTYNLVKNWREIYEIITNSKE